MQSETADYAPGAATRRTGRNIPVVFDSGLFSALYENETSSTKPEVHTMLHCRQRRTEPRPQITCIENLVKFGRVVCELRNGKRQTNSQTSRQTERYADHNTLHFIHIYASCSGRHGVGQGNINILQHLQSN